MTNKERICRQLAGERVDRVPMLGGWNEGMRVVCRIAGLTAEQYLADPLAGVVRCNQALGVDGMMPPVVPKDLAEIRSGSLQESRFEAVGPEALKERADAIPATEAQVLAAFDEAAAEQAMRQHFEQFQTAFGGIVQIPNFWNVPTDFSLYFQFGYVAFLSAVAMYPESVGRIYWEESIRARRRNEMLANLIRRYDLPPVVFTGSDICSQQGPMCSPGFLREHYWPAVKRALGPLTAASVRVVAHCDGNVMPLIDDMIEAGFSGFQGFQFECGVDPYDIRRRTSPWGDPLLFFTGMSVTRTLPFGSTRDVERDIDYCLDLTDGGRGLFLFSSNVTGVETPPENIVAAYRYLASYDPATGRVNRPAYRTWPWAENHPL